MKVQFQSKGALKKPMQMRFKRTCKYVFEHFRMPTEAEPCGGIGARILQAATVASMRVFKPTRPLNGLDSRLLSLDAAHFLNVYLPCLYYEAVSA